MLHRPSCEGPCPSMTLSLLQTSQVHLSLEASLWVSWWRKALHQGAYERGHFCTTHHPYSRTLPGITDYKSEISPLSSIDM